MSQYPVEDGSKASARRSPEVEELLEQWEDRRRQGIEPLASDLTSDLHLQQVLEGEIERLKVMDWLDAEELQETVGVDASQLNASTPPTPWDMEDCVPYFLSHRYVLESLIAGGGFGQVWRAWDRTLERMVAVKLSKLDSSAEARRVAQLQHPGIVGVHDLGTDAGLWYIVFDLIEGTDLARRMAEDPPDWPEAARIVSEVAETLQYAHEHGFIHRDVKPANILLTKSDKPVLADFGIAVTEQEMKGETTTTAGTLAYMAPELLVGDAKGADVYTDVYGLGVVLYQILNHQLPFPGRNFFEVRRRILSGEPPEWICEDCPDKLRAITLRCLAKDPDMRYPTAGKDPSARASSKE
jgi:serine/threonine protein kinase